MNKFRNIFALFLLSIIRLLLFVGVSRSSPTVDPPSALLSSRQRLESQDIWTPRGHERNTISLSQTAKSSAFEKRVLDNFSTPTISMKMISFKTITLMTPLIGAAQFLEEFYAAVAIKAAGVWSSLPRERTLTINQGLFSLIFTSTGDTIPWSFVKEMADRLWEAACLGAAELFDAMYMDEIGRVAVAISLRLADGSSSSSSDTDYREGSVPSVGTPYD